MPAEIPANSEIDADVAAASGRLGPDILADMGTVALYVAEKAVKQVIEGTDTDAPCCPDGECPSCVAQRRTMAHDSDTARLNAYAEVLKAINGGESFRAADGAEKAHEAVLNAIRRIADDDLGVA